MVRNNDAIIIFELNIVCIFSNGPFPNFQHVMNQLIIYGHELTKSQGFQIKRTFLEYVKQSTLQLQNGQLGFFNFETFLLSGSMNSKRGQAVAKTKPKKKCKKATAEDVGTAVRDIGPIDSLIQLGNDLLKHFDYLFVNNPDAYTSIRKARMTGNDSYYKWQDCKDECLQLCCKDVPISKKQADKNSCLSHNLQAWLDCIRADYFEEKALRTFYKFFSDPSPKHPQSQVAIAGMLQRFRDLGWLVSFVMSCALAAYKELEGKLFIEQYLIKCITKSGLDIEDISKLFYKKLKRPLYCDVKGTREYVVSSLKNIDVIIIYD